MFATVGLVVLFVLGVYIFTRRKLYILSWKLSGPPAPLPVIGNGISLMCDSKDVFSVWSIDAIGMYRLHRSIALIALLCIICIRSVLNADLLKQILKITDPYPSPLRLWIGPKLIVFIKDPDQLQTAMQSSKFTKKSFVYRFLEPFMGKGLFTSSGTKHKNQRKLLQPLFGARVLEGYSVLFQKHAENLVNLMEIHSGKGLFDILNILHESAFEATMDILVEDKNDHDIDYKDIPGYVRRFYHIFTQRVITFWLYSELIFKMTGFYKEQQHMIKIASNLTEDVTSQRLPEIVKRLDDPDETSNKTEKRTPSVLEMMMQLMKDNPDCLTRDEFRDHMMTFVATSQDTQSSAIAFTLMMLGIHKYIQDNVMNELKEVLEDRKVVHFNDTGKLKYMEMCIKEAMRLFPLGPFLPRDVIEGFKLDKWYIPKGCSLILGVYNVHRNPKYWERPDEFYPEHFADEPCSKRHPYAFLPFSGGPRRCIAQQYSYVNMKIIIANILLNYIIDCPYTLKDLELMTDVSIRPTNGYMIRISKRT